jgi:hypothetical protein
MTFTLPHTIVGGERENAAHLMRNDQAVRDAINEAAAKVEYFYGAATYFDSGSAQATGWVNHAAGAMALAPSVVFQPWPATMYINPADYEVDGFTTKWQIYLTIGVGSVNPGITGLGVHLRPFSAMSTDAIDLTGTPVGSVTVDLDEPGLSIVTAASNEFEIDTASAYVLALAQGSSAPAANELFTLYAQLRMWHE